jgi:hypothetical protein
MYIIFPGNTVQARGSLLQRYSLHYQENVSREQVDPVQAGGNLYFYYVALKSSGRSRSFLG